MITFSVFVNNTPVIYTCVTLSILGICLLARRLYKQTKQKSPWVPLCNVYHDQSCFNTSPNTQTQTQEINIDDVLNDETPPQSSNQRITQIDFVDPTSVTNVSDITNMSVPYVQHVPIRRSIRLAQRQANRIQTLNTSEVSTTSQSKQSKI